MPAGLTRSETKHYVHETTTCCACSAYLDYGLPEAGSDDIEIRDIKWRTLNLDPEVGTCSSCVSSFYC